MTSKTPETEHSNVVPKPAETVDSLDALNTPEEIDAPKAETDPRIKSFVENGLKLTAEKPRKWFSVNLPEDQVRKVTKEAKAYARESGYTFRVKTTEDATRLVYRVTAKVVREDG